MVAHTEENNGSLEFIALKDPYENVDAHAVNNVQADKAFDYLFYSGENKPHM